MTGAVNVFLPVKDWSVERCAVSASKYALAIAVPCQVPVPIVPTEVSPVAVVILFCVVVAIVPCNSPLALMFEPVIFPIV